MLDLDSIATQRARRLNQTVELWLNAVWSDAFQRFSANLSDGEVEQILGWCPSVAHLQSLVGYLEAKGKENGLTPFPCLENAAKQAQVSPEDWIKKHLPMSPSS